MAVLDGLSVSSAPPLATALRGRTVGVLRGLRLPVCGGLACVLGFVVGNKVSVFSW